MAPSTVIGYDRRLAARHVDNTGDAERIQMLLRRAIVVLAAALALAAAAPALAQQAKPATVFTVTPVPVDVTADSAAAARDQAIVQGESHAFDMLMQRLTMRADQSRLPKITPDQLNELVQGFEVAHERRSSVRYLADFTVYFHADAVRQLLRGAGIGFAETASKPVVVLPVLHDGDRVTLWEDPNPWRDAWTSASIPPGLVPFVRPLGDLGDVQAIDGDAAAKGDNDKLQAVSQHYDNDDVLVTQATLKTDGAQHELDISSTRYSPSLPGSEQTWVTTTTATAGESDAVLDTAAQVEDAWKAANILDLGQSGVLTATVPAPTLQDWVTVRDRLAAIPAVRSAQLVALDRGQATVEIHYVGDPDQFRTALTQRDLELGGSDPNWVLQRRSVPAASQ
jgi:hypothetical protein